MSAPTPAVPLMFAAGFFLAAGAAMIALPHPMIRAYVRLVKPMRGLFGSIVDWEIGLLESRTAPWLVRGFGLFVMLAGASIVVFPIMGRAG